MATFICEFCKNKCNGDSVPTKCSVCGNDDQSKWKIKRPPLLILSDSTGRLIFFKNEEVGRDNFRVFKGEGYKYLSRKHFTVRLVDENWEIEVHKEVTNSVFLNGKDITGERSQLKNGDKLRIGPVEITVSIRES